MMNDLLGAGLRFLAFQGLNLAAILDRSRLPAPVEDVLRDYPPCFQRLVLIGNGGGELWRALGLHGAGDGPDPVDTFSRIQAEFFVHRFLGAPDWQLLYPGLQVLPLQQLGHVAGWGFRSPLGLDIHPQFGIWFAYRCALLVAADLPVTLPASGSSPCESCPDKPCAAACPVDAVSVPGRFKLDVCLAERRRDDSDCAARCRARDACPVGVEHRYPADQIAHYGRCSLASIRRYAAAADSLS